MLSVSWHLLYFSTYTYCTTSFSCRHVLLWTRNFQIKFATVLNLLQIHVFKNWEFHVIKNWEFHVYKNLRISYFKKLRISCPFQLLVSNRDVLLSVPDFSRLNLSHPIFQLTSDKESELSKFHVFDIAWQRV